MAGHLSLPAIKFYVGVKVLAGEFWMLSPPPQSLRISLYRAGLNLSLAMTKFRLFGGAKAFDGVTALRKLPADLRCYCKAFLIARGLEVQEQRKYFRLE